MKSNKLNIIRTLTSCEIEDSGGKTKRQISIVIFRLYVKVQYFISLSCWLFMTSVIKIYSG